jgi:hypothetical protein
MKIDGVLDMLGAKKQNTYSKDGGSEQIRGTAKFKSKKI